MGAKLRFVKSAQRHISTFISHSARNNDEAQYYENLLKDAGFSVFQYGEDLHFGSPIQSVLLEKISKCHFFVLVVSEHSLESPWVQRELGLAIALQQKNRNYRPIIIPLYAKEAAWRRTGNRPTTFPTRDFETGEMREPFNLAVRGVDKYSSPIADSDENFISFLRPSLIVTRLDFDDDATFTETGVFDLYKDLFPPIERDDPQDIVRWVLHDDIGKKRTFVLSDGKEVSYTLDSRYFILRLADRAIGLGFFTYDYSSDLIYGNYIGVQECWRGGDIATAFFKEITVILQELFPRSRGMVFEVEKFHKERVEEIVTGLEKSGSTHVEALKDRSEIRKFLRVSWYQKLNCSFFFDKKGGEPLTCRSPCLDPNAGSEEWAKTEEDYWIMWYGPLDLSRAKELWGKAVTSIYIEILAKSLVESCPENGQEYWNYSTAIIDKTLRDVDSKEINFSKFLHRRDSPLLARWISLGINLPI